MMMMTYKFNQTNNVPHSIKQRIDFHRSFSTPCLSLAATHQVEGELLNVSSATVNPNRIEIIYDNHGAPRVRALIVEVAVAMASGLNLVPASGGLGGAYFIHGRNGSPIAVIKPTDEESLAVNNPKGRMLGQPGMKRSVQVGETGLRELAAYLLDHDGFAGVPPTALVKISHIALYVNSNNKNDKNYSEGNYSPTPPPYKVASLQHFVNHDSDAGDIGPSSFLVASVHQIGILDVRLLNLDRHSGNILVKHGHENYAIGATELVPIDHGLCLPESLDDPYFEWLHWPQALVPFSDSEIEYVSNLDPFMDAELLRDEIPSLRESSIRVLVLCTIFLKVAIAARFCLADIGDMMTREFCCGGENFSLLEKLCMTAKISVSSIILSYDASSINGDQSEEEKEVENTEMFQFDHECDDSYNKNPSNISQFLESPIMVNNPQKLHRFFSARSMTGLLDATLSPFTQEEEQDDDGDGGKCDCDKIAINNHYDKKQNDRDDDHKVGSLMKSMSFSVQNYNHENGGISFGEMSKEEWDLFLESFEKLLPKAFEEAKTMGLWKQRLENSCEF